MEVGKRVKVLAEPTFSGMTGTITNVSKGVLGITVLLDYDDEEYPFDANELEVIE